MMRLAVDKRAEPRILVAQNRSAVIDRDFGVDARNVGAWQTEVGFAAPSDCEQRFVDGDDPPAERIGDERRG